MKNLLIFTLLIFSAFSQLESASSRVPSSTMCQANYIWNGGCVKLCTHPDFRSCGNVFPLLYNPSFCGLLRGGGWRSYTYACQACASNEVVGVLDGKCGCNVQACPSGQQCINNTCQNRNTTTTPPTPVINCSMILCKQGFTCSYNKCVPTPGYCNTQTDCQSWQFCLQGRCADRCASIRCASGYICTRGQCVRAPNQCRYSYQCANGLTCSPSGQCVDKCQGIVCIATHRCLGGQCVPLCTNIQCSQGFQCYNGQCQPIPGYCSTNSQCQNTQICHMSRCINFCSIAVCSNNTVCSGNKCVPNNQCANNQQCPSNKRCKNHVCVDGCENVLCPTLYRCQDGQCVPIDGYCYLNSHCLINQQCSNGRCVNRCSLVLCPPGSVCSSANGSCVYLNNNTCYYDFQCSNDKKCISNTCVDKCYNILCPTSTVCIGGSCINTNPCASILCINGSTCTNGQCTPIYPTCFTSSTCKSTQFCLQNKCTDKCATIRCTNGYLCQNGECVSACSQVVCPVGSACFQGRCVSIGYNCRNDNNCGNEQMCRNGYCVSKCANVQCPAGSYCVAGECKLDLDVCPTQAAYTATTCTVPRPNNTTCPVIYYFVEQPPSFCGVKADGSRVNFIRSCQACKDSTILYYFNKPCHQVPFVCAKNEQCLDYYCSSAQCRSDEQCPYDWQTCIQGKCVDRCSLWRCANCKYGQCGYMQPYGDCRIDGDCPNNNWTCLGWKCVDQCWNVRCPHNHKCVKGQCVSIGSW